MPILKMTDEEWECLSGCVCECGYDYMLDDIIELKDHTPIEKDDEPKSLKKKYRLKKVKITSD